MPFPPLFNIALIKVFFIVPFPFTVLAFVDTAAFLDFAAFFVAFGAAFALPKLASRSASR